MHNNVEVTYHLKFRLYNDDIREECCEFVRHLLSIYISKQNDDPMRDNRLYLIWLFHSMVPAVRSMNP